MDLFRRWKILLLALTGFAGASSAGETYRSEQFGYSVDLPAGWIRVPDNVFRETAALAASSPGKSRFMDVAFQRKDDPWFDGPYAVIMVFPTGGQLSEEQMAETIRMIAGIKPEQLEEGVNPTLRPLLELRPGTVRFDRTRHAFTWRMPSKVSGVSRVVTSHGFFGRSSLVQLSFYDRSGSHAAANEIELVKSFKFDPAFEYVRAAPPTRSGPTQAGIGAALGSTRGALSAADADTLASLLATPNRWNRAAAPLVRDYLDPNVLPARWVADASIHIGELRAAQVEMYTCALAIRDPGIRATFVEVALNYRAKLDSITALHQAVAQGDPVAEERAMASLSEAAAEGQVLANALLDRLRPYVDPDVLSAELRKRGREIGDLMKPK